MFSARCLLRTSCVLFPLVLTSLMSCWKYYCFHFLEWKLRSEDVKSLTQGKYRASNCRGRIQIQSVSFQSPHMDPLGYNACHLPSYASWGQRLVNGCRDTKPELLNLSCHRVLWQASLQTSSQNVYKCIKHIGLQREVF